MSHVSPDHQVAQMSDKLEKSLSIDADANKIDIYHGYIKDGKEEARQGDLSKALELFKHAHKIRPSEKLKSRIGRIEELISQDLESDDEEFVNVNNSGLMLLKEVHEKLYDHQKEGVSFIYKLYRDGLKGGILADDMGLGKTIQVIAFLAGMYDGDLVKHTLLVMPTSLITTWTKEFAKWTPGMRVKEFHGTKKAERTRNIEKVQRRGGVIITTYQMLIPNWQQVASYNGQEFIWDYMILDEAHKIKTSSTKTAKSAHAIPAHNRLLLTGTPVQNNLQELWSLFNFACQGALLGTSKTFKTEYENTITRAKEKDATPGEKALGLKMSQNLMNIIKPHFLRRTKADVQKKNSQTEKENHSKPANGDDSDKEKRIGAIMPELGRKNDLIIWTYLSDVQENIYRQFLSLDHIKELLTTTRSPLAELNVLKKLCDHPRLLSGAASLGLEDGTPESQGDEDCMKTSNNLDHITDDTLIGESGKMVFLMTLLERLRMEGHQTLVFAMFRKVLDILERVLGNRGFKTIRLDGTIIQMAERERRITLFQNDKQYSVFLLTTKVGGVGITLTAANRVVIYDPSWNPATDAQAVDRAYRIGQTKNVVVYRLITCGTVEEKIYRRQVFKDSIIRQTTGDKKNPFCYFSKQELKELFIMEETRSSSTQLQLQSMHSQHRRTDPELDEHIADLHSMEMFGISDHDLMFSLDPNHEQDPQDQEAHEYIEGRVRKAQELMKAESELHKQLAENMESSTEPAWRQQLTQRNKERSHGQKDPTGKPRSPVVYVEDDSDESPVVVIELDQSGSSMEDDKLNITNSSFKMEQSDVKEESVYEVSSEMKSADAASEGNTSLGGFASAAIHDQILDNQESFSKVDNSGSQATAMQEEHQLYDPVQNKRLSILQLTNVSLHDRASSGAKSFEGNFNLLLEDSENDLSNNLNLLEEPDVEAQEVKLLSQLQSEGSFNVDKSLAEFEQVHRMSFNHSHVSESDQSENDSIIMTKKKRGAVIYDSEEEEEGKDDEKVKMMSSCLNDSFEFLQSSTPKSLPSECTPFRGRKSIGGNVSVALMRSMVKSIVEDVESDLEDEVNGSEVDEAIEDTSVHSGDESEQQTDLSASLDASESGGDEPELEETKGESLHTENEEDESEQETDLSASLDASESGGDKPELEETKGESLHTENEEDESEQETDLSASLDASESGGDKLELEETKGESLHTENEEDESEQETDLSASLDTSASGDTEKSRLEESTRCPESASLHSEENSDESTTGSDRMANVSSRGSGKALADHEASTVEPVFDSDGSYEALVNRGRRCYSEGNLQDALGFFLEAMDISSGDTEIQLLVIQLYRRMSR
ncbi:hypothetical protein NHX12_029442 [Muraenolepis orangiensis]|uniref:DNA excision repair protein ERCC-6-like n=1 Tax=Muraenolepis orangiensis TaxID=630683 RepID=A0A9Q0EB60_9TELE|nr:hypothetical protein NHX12_029442 [Muraenolepis orangiensis]